MKNVTISEVAKLANVSLATVSRVINQTGPVKEATYKKVIDAINSLGYELEESPMPVPQYNGPILFNPPAVSNPFYSEIIRGAKMSAARHGFQVLIYEDYLNQNTLPAFLTIIKKSKCAGLITINQAPVSTLQSINKLIPVVQCNEYNEAIDLPYVSIDDIQAGVNVVDYLASLGRKRIAIINGPEYFKYAAHRFLGYKQGLEKSNLPYDPQLVVNLPNVSYDLAMSAAMQLINASYRPDAFFATLDVFAVAILRAAHLCGFRVPDDFVVVGFDNIDITTVTIPTITTVNQPKLQLGFTACEILFERLQNPNSPIQKVLLETELIIRESTKSF